MVVIAAVLSTVSQVRDKGMRTKGEAAASPSERYPNTPQSRMHL